MKNVESKNLMFEKSRWGNGCAAVYLDRFMKIVSWLFEWWILCFGEVKAYRKYIDEMYRFVSNDI